MAEDDAEDCASRPQESPCDCRAAVTRAYMGMLASGTPPSRALGAAVRVYLYHHPSAPETRAQETVEAWVAVTGTMH